MSHHASTVTHHDHHGFLSDPTEFTRLVNELKNVPDDVTLAFCGLASYMLAGGLFPHHSRIALVRKPGDITRASRINIVGQHHEIMTWWFVDDLICTGHTFNHACTAIGSSPDRLVLYDSAWFSYPRYNYMGIPVQYIGPTMEKP